ncbi:unnamed protein product [Rotaria magnacalcarata]|uniref:Uncharacterized protein n=1 Tax=Rotaria magnacalcarata TaxID=392030 RepID=A0A816NU56_9BILA|nr:unnamed protein product [Rotaria magnacalcarata]
MQQAFVRPLVSIIARSNIILRSNFGVDMMRNKTVEHARHDNDLICSSWEEAIIKECRKPDIPLDILQKQTIDTIHNEDCIQQLITESLTGDNKFYRIE